MGEASRRRISGTIPADRLDCIQAVGASVDALTEADRWWFERQPHRAHRIRVMARSEDVQMAAIADLGATRPAGPARRPGTPAPVGPARDQTSTACCGIYDLLCRADIDRLEAELAQAIDGAAR